MTYGKVSARGPEGDFSRTPVVGERFYIRTEVGILDNPWSAVDTYKTSLLLPDGLAPSITASDDVICAVTDLADSSVRQPGPSECADPVQSGAQWVLPAVALVEGGGSGQLAQFWIPVKATKPVTGKIQMTGLAVTNPLGLGINPVLSEVEVVVNADPNGNGDRPGDTTGKATTPSRLAVAAKGRGTATLSWQAPTTMTGISGYRIQQRVRGATKWRTAGKAKATATTFTVRRLKRGVRYQVRIGSIVNGTVTSWAGPIALRAR